MPSGLFFNPINHLKMKTFTITQFGSTTEVYIRQRNYPNGRPALELIDVTDHIPYAVATVNLPDVLLEDNEVLVKDYSENEGILDFLIDNNIVTPTKKGVQSGFVWVPVCTLNPESQWGNNFPPPEQINPENNQCMWTINGYRIWAHSYREALDLLPLIESF